MRGKKRFKTINKNRYFAIARPIKKEVDGVEVFTGEYEYYNGNTFGPLGAKTKRYCDPIEPTLYAAENINEYCETHLVETYIKNWII